MIADGDDICVPCGGCRQRLREFMPLDAPRSTCAPRPARAQTSTLEALLPRSFGRSSCPDERHRRAGAPRLGIVLGSGLGGARRRARGRVTIPYAELAGFPAAERRRPRRHARARHARRPAGRVPAGPQARLRGRRPGRDARPGPRAQGSAAPRRCSSPTPPARCDADVGPGSLMAITDHINMLGVNPLTGPERRRDRPALPEPARRLRPGAARPCCAPPRARSDIDARRGRLPRHRRPELRDARPRSARSARSAPTRSACRPSPR